MTMISKQSWVIMSTVINKDNYKFVIHMNHRKDKKMMSRRILMFVRLKKKEMLFINLWHRWVRKEGRGWSWEMGRMKNVEVWRLRRWMLVSNIWSESMFPSHYNPRTAQISSNSTISLVNGPNTRKAAYIPSTQRPSTNKNRYTEAS